MRKGEGGRDRRHVKPPRQIGDGGIFPVFLFLFFFPFACFVFSLSFLGAMWSLSLRLAPKIAGISCAALVRGPEMGVTVIPRRGQDSGSSQYAHNERDTSPIPIP